MKGDKSFIKQDLILKAASNIVQRDGVAQLTLEALAKEAGISKGGLLYHFSSKEALIKGMMDKLNESYGAEIQRKAEEDQQSHGAWSRAYVEATFNELDCGVDMSSALFAAAFANPKLLEGMQAQYKVWQSHIENDGTDSVQATIARLAADGLWFAEMFGLAPLDTDLRNKVYHELISWTKEERH
ncbi:TetR/AcrR family transcriptional regulator [Paenibacillus monticola]|uniref:TetR family transcriptional regulator n=1 Tax=Paenibacillus monticola TaxID=2666075 RepID=A0A7X2H7W7_9BACL|nr:TetR/AcrR family transcriptional regulator [Paenibacillus monticola]MRN55156.1 TetR family transcriptional regulator [Paenibacillus monticola]